MLTDVGSYNGPLKLICVYDAKHLSRSKLVARLERRFFVESELVCFISVYDVVPLGVFLCFNPCRYSREGILYVADYTEVYLDVFVYLKFIFDCNSLQALKLRYARDKPQ